MKIGNGVTRNGVWPQWTRPEWGHFDPSYFRVYAEAYCGGKKPASSDQTLRQKYLTNQNAEKWSNALLRRICSSCEFSRNNKSYCVINDPGWYTSKVLTRI